MSDIDRERDLEIAKSMKAYREQNFSIGEEMGRYREQQGLLPSAPEVFAKGVVRGVEGLLASSGDVARWAGDITNIGALSKAGTWWQEYWTKAASEGWEAPDPYIFRGDFLDAPSFKRAFGIIGEALPSLALAFTGAGLGSAAARGVGVGKKLSAAAQAARVKKVGMFTGAGTLGLLEGAPQYREAREAGKGEAEASFYGAASVAATTALEFVGLQMLLKDVAKGPLKKVGKYALGQAGIKGLSEATQEMSQTVAQNFIAKYGYDDTRQLFEGIMEAAIGGFGVGAIASPTTKKLNDFYKKHPDVTDEEIQGATDVIQAVVEEKAAETERQPKTSTTVEEDLEATRKAREENGTGDDFRNKEIIAKIGTEADEAKGFKKTIEEGAVATKQAEVEEAKPEPVPKPVKEEPEPVKPKTEEELIEERRKANVRRAAKAIRGEEWEIDEADELEAKAKKKIDEINKRRADDIEKEGVAQGLRYLDNQNQIKSQLTGSLARYQMDKKGLAKGDKGYSEEKVEKSKKQLQDRLAEDINQPRYRPVIEGDFGGRTATNQLGHKFKHVQTKDGIEVGLKQAELPSGERSDYWMARHPEGRMYGIGSTMANALKEAKKYRAEEKASDERKKSHRYTPADLDEESNATIRQIAKARGIEKHNTKRIATLKNEILNTQDELAATEKVTKTYQEKADKVTPKEVAEFFGTTEDYYAKAPKNQFEMHRDLYLRATNPTLLQKKPADLTKLSYEKGKIPDFATEEGRRIAKTAREQLIKDYGEDEKTTSPRHAITVKLADNVRADPKFMDALVKHPDSKELFGANRQEIVENHQGIDEIPVMVEFENAVYHGTIGDAIYARGFHHREGKKTGGKTQWGDLVAIRPFHKDAEGLGYSLKKTSPIYQKQVTRNELKGLMPKGKRGVLGNAAKMTKTKFLETTSKEDADLIKEKTGLTLEEAWRAMKKGDYGLIKKMAKAGKLAKESQVPGALKYDRPKDAELEQIKKDILSGKYAEEPKAEFNIDDLAPRLEGVDVNVKALDEAGNELIGKDDKPITAPVDAVTAYRDVVEKIAIHDKILNCLGN